LGEEGIDKTGSIPYEPYKLLVQKFGQRKYIKRFRLLSGKLNRNGR